MRNKNYTAIILEGESRERTIVENLMTNCLQKDNYKIIAFPAGVNIYMLWLELKKDMFETDVIEVVKEMSSTARDILLDIERNDISEIILFFDYDAHQSNLPDDVDPQDVLKKMLKTFDNETELGKLYISYPMVEALRDHIPNRCVAFTNSDCVYNLQEFHQYKEKSGIDNPMINIKNYKFTHWKEIINIFALRVSCLFDRTDVMNFEEYRELVSPCTIYNRQQTYIQADSIFILSAFPEYLLDYFGLGFWNTCVKRRHLIIEDHCRRR